MKSFKILESGEIVDEQSRRIATIQFAGTKYDHLLRQNIEADADEIEKFRDIRNAVAGFRGTEKRAVMKDLLEEIRNIIDYEGA